MRKYRIKEVDGRFFPQERLWFIWMYICGEDQIYFQESSGNCYKSIETAEYWIKSRIRYLDAIKTKKITKKPSIIYHKYNHQNNLIKNGKRN